MNTEQQTNSKEDAQMINALLQDYFDGLYEGDVAKLRNIFHDDAWLKGNHYRKSRDEWLVTGHQVESGAGPLTARIVGKMLFGIVSERQ